MVGKEIADVLVPFIIAGAVLAVLYFLYRRHRKGIIAKRDLEHVADTSKERSDAEKEMRKQGLNALERYRARRTLARLHKHPDR